MPFYKPSIENNWHNEVKAVIFKHCVMVTTLSNLMYVLSEAKYHCGAAMF